MVMGATVTVNDLLDGHVGLDLRGDTQARTAGCAPGRPMISDHSMRPTGGASFTNEAPWRV